MNQAWIYMCRNFFIIITYYRNIIIVTKQKKVYLKKNVEITLAVFDGHKEDIKKKSKMEKK